MSKNSITRSGIRTLCENAGIEPDQFSKLNQNEKIIVTLLSNKIDQMNSSFASALKERDEKISNLEKEVSSMKIAYDKLENKFEDYEAMARGNTLIISGSDVPASTNNEDCSSVVRYLIRNKLKYSVQDQSVSYAYRLGIPPPTQKPDKGSILVKLENEHIVQSLIRTSKLVKPTNLFFSENLIPKRHSILLILRKLKKDHPVKISGCSAIRGRVYAWIKPPNPDAIGARNTRIMINTRKELEDFCTRVLEVNLGEVISQNDLI